jgi:hypothetical protein
MFQAFLVMFPAIFNDFNVLMANEYVSVNPLEFYRGKTKTTNKKRAK